MKPIELRDFLSYQFLSGVRFSPDGQRAAFVVSNCLEEENTYESRLWLYDGGVRQLTSLGKERSFLWEDGEHLLFPAVRSVGEKKRQEAQESFTSYYRLDIRGGEAMPAFTVPFQVGKLELVPGGYVAAGTLDAAYPDEYAMTTEERAKVAQARKEEGDYQVLDEIPFWSNGGGYSNKRRRALFVEQDGKVRRVTEPLFDLWDFALLGDKVYYVGLAYAARQPISGSQLWRLDLATGENVLLREEENLRLSELTVVGETLLAGGSEGARHGLNENSWIYQVDPDSGAVSVLRQEEYSMYGSVGSDCRYGGGLPWEAVGSSLYHLTTREDSAHLYRLDLDGSSHGVVTKPGSIDSFSVSEVRGEILMVALYGGNLQELYAVDLKTGDMRQVSHFNQAVLEGKYVAAFQPLTVESQGETICGYVLLPKDFDPAKKYPAILDIHGGPKTVYGPVFYHEMQLWASMGYFVFFCNPKGGDGRDNRFMDIRGAYGQTDYQNLMDFTDAVLAAWPQIEEKRVCVTGGSYGGFMTNWIIGHTDRFCCAASQRSISNWLSFYGVSDIGYYFAADQCGGDIYDDAEKLWSLSPLKYAKAVKTPTLFIHSDEDYRCPLEQGLQMYTALQDRGVPSRLCMFHGENHELSRSGKPKHRVRRLEEMTRWFEAYAKG